MLEIIHTVGDNHATLVFEYKAQFIEALKSCVRHTDRRYNPETKEWTVRAELIEDIAALALDWWPESVWIVTTDDDKGETVRRNVAKGTRVTQKHLFAGG